MTVPVDKVLTSAWTRRHDDPRQPLLIAYEIAYPKSLAELVELCQGESQLKAAGSHWALSPAAISEYTFVETHDPAGIHQAMGKTITDVISKALHPSFKQWMQTPEYRDRYGTLVHVEAGKRIYQLYAELDEQGWGFGTLGGAGGQTVVGAFSTGTHGGDFDRRPLTDAVAAIHLVGDGGHQFWIEKVDATYSPRITDDVELRKLYGGPEVFSIIREPDNTTFNAALVGVGRIGIIYSVMLRAVKQYSLWERCRLHVWQDIRKQIVNTGSPLYTDNAAEAPNTPQRFLQVAVCLTPHLGFSRNLVGITKRWEIPVVQAPEGTSQRVGSKIADPAAELLNGGPVYTLAGNAFPYRPNPNEPYKANDDPNFLNSACAKASFLAEVLQEVYDEIEEFVTSNGTAVGTGIAAVAALGGFGLLQFLGAFGIVLLILKELLDQFNTDDRLGEHMNNIKNELLDPAELDPARRAAGLFAWQMVAYKVFALMQEDAEFGAKSFAVMDRKNYRDRSCEWNVESMEVFFNASDTRVTAFIDALIAFEIMQEIQGKAFVGYASLRFTGPSDAYLGMQKHPITCAIEVAGLKDVSGTQELIDFAVGLALNPNMGGILHWGQRNDSSADDIQRLFGDINTPGNGSLGAWRRALVRLGGTGVRFSSDFTQCTGLEP